MFLTKFIKKAHNIERDVVHTISVDVSWMRDPAHQQTILNGIHDVSTFSEKALPVVEGMAKMLLPGDAMIIDSVDVALNKLLIKADTFSQNPSLGTFLQVGGVALQHELAVVLPELTNGIEIAGQVVHTADELNAIDPSVFQSIIHANITNYITSAGAVDIQLQSLLSKLTTALASQASTSAPATLLPPQA